ncbi:hypothetical protein [Halosimplex pelagicum]|uniref:Uncharacterized protein n=1 Tax=Halosimplex pelagicum TaxID=869886 RepID=A0A7D5PEV4_9EURY|nr:hypothetical protein [Halosimplex pelagicum]QLH82460.1 hypothetical protein HZS54_12920 [Halosimplex pelagicum]QLH82516.1 hypothetical protein HZS54_13225 [Halosimplex pelagicum]
MSTNQPAPTESALQNVRAEWIPSTFDSDGIPRVPEDPEWNRYGDYIASYPGWSGDAGVEGQQAAGSGDTTDHFRGAEEHDLTVQWWLQRFFIDGDGNANDPIGELLTYDYQTSEPTHEVLFRREVDSGGAKGAGFREYVYGSGCRPSSGAAPGDPSASSPIVAEAGYAAEKVTQIIIHQPADGVTPEVVSTSAEDTTQTVTIESEGGTTSDTFTLDGTTSVTGDTGESFSDIDAIWVDGSHVGDIDVKDGNGNSLLEDPLVGTETDGVDAVRGVPILGAGSRASAIGTDVSNYLFLGTSSSWDGGALAESAAADRVHALDLSIEVDISREARQGTRRQSIDCGSRTVSVDADLAGPYESAKQNYNYFTGKEGDVVYGYPDGDVTVNNAQLTDDDDVEHSGGDSNLIYGITLEGHGDPAVEATHS